MNEQMKIVEECIQALEVLVSPSFLPLKSDDKTISLKKLLSTNLDKFEKEALHSLSDNLVDNTIEVDSSDDTDWTFIVFLLRILKTVKACMAKAVDIFEKQPPSEENTTTNNGPPMSPEILGSKQQNIILCSLQFVICLGMCPSFMKGVGIPLTMRTQFSSFIEENCEARKPFSEMRWRLFVCTEVFLNLLEIPSLGSLVLSRCLGDLLASLIQLCHGPKSKTEVQKRHEDIPKMMTMKNSEWCQQQLKKIVGNVYPTLVVRELLLLQSGPPPKTKDCVHIPPPQWLTKVCARLLTDILLRPNKGVQFILRGMLNEHEENPSSSDWRKCEAAAKVISTCPTIRMPDDQYFKQICPQVIELLHLENKSIARQFVRVASSTISLMHKTHPKLANTYLLSPLLEPLLLCLVESEGHHLTVCNESRLALCVEDIQKICILQNTTLLESMIPVCVPLCKLYQFIRKSVSYMKTACHDIIVVFFKHLDLDHVLDLVKSVAYTENQRTSSVGLKKVRTVTPGTAGSEWLDLNTFHANSEMHGRITFSLGNDGGVKIITTDTQQDDLANFEENAEYLVHLLKDSNRDELTAEFFLYLLENLSSLIQGETRKKEIVISGMSLSDQQVVQLKKNLQTLSLIAQMCEHLPSTCFSKTSHILRFTKITLERGVSILTSEHSDEELGLFEGETLTMAMGLLTAIMGGAAKISPEDRQATQELLPLLQQLADHHPDHSVQEMAVDLRVAIATHGMVLSELIKEKQKMDRSHSPQTNQKQDDKPTCMDMNDSGMKSENIELRVKEEKASTRPLIEEISDFPVDHSEKDASKSELTSESTKNVEKQTSKSQRMNVSTASNKAKQDVLPDVLPGTKPSSLQQSLEELMDPLVPVRGHGLISLRKLIERGDEDTLDKRDMLLQVFCENLNHEDSYIYLAAVGGIIALADKVPKDLLPVLTKEYAKPSGKSGNCIRGAERRLKLGEVLVKVSRALGPLVPAYREELVNCLLTGAKDDDEFVRASAISNLGEVCKMLHYSLQGVLWEVMSVVQSLVMRDSSVEVRKSGAMFITLLLQGLGNQAFKVLDASLKDLYRLLKQVYLSEKDEGVKLHVNLALEELDIIMKDFLFPKQVLEKKISVVDLPERWL